MHDKNFEQIKKHVKFKFAKFNNVRLCMMINSHIKIMSKQVKEDKYISGYNDSSSDIFNWAARYTSNGRPPQMNIMTHNSVPKDGYACETRVKHITWSSFGSPIKLCC